MKARLHASSNELTEALTARLMASFAQPSDEGPTMLMLAGGSTPMAAYKAIAEHAPAVKGPIGAFMSDERMVPGDSDQNNFHNARPLFEALGLSAAHQLAVETDSPVEEAADAYNVALRNFLKQPGARIPLGILGLGADGHTASLFSQNDLDRGKDRLAIAVNRPDGRQAVSVTPELLQRIDRLLFVVAGSAKAAVVEQLRHHPEEIIAGRAVKDCQRVELWCAIE